MTSLVDEMFDTLDVWLRKQRERLDPKPRVPTSQERESWFASSTDKKPSDLSVDGVKVLLRQRNFVRMRRLQKDFAWMQRQMVKMGRNPEDARWLL